MAWALSLIAGCAAPELGEDARDPHAVVVAVTAPAEVRCVSDDDERAIHTEGRATLHGLIADTDYRCSATYDGGGSSAAVPWHSGALPDGLPRPEVSVPDRDAGFHLLNLSVEGAVSWLMVVDAHGRPRWELPGLGAAGVDATWLGDGVMYLDEDQPPVVVDLDGLGTWRAVWSADAPGELADGWHHDAGPTEDGEGVLTLAAEQVGAGSVLGFVVKDVPWYGAGARWSWSVTEDGADALPATEPDTFHANAVSEVPGGVLVGLRNLGAVVKIDRETREIEWRLGRGGDFVLLEADGTPAEDDRWFGAHHDAKLIGDRLYLFDNATAARGSRVVVLELDEAARTARFVLEWQRSPSWYASRWGGVDPLPDGGVSVAFDATGSGQPASTLLHLSAEAERVWQLDLPAGVGVYRSDWFARME